MTIGKAEELNGQVIIYDAGGRIVGAHPGTLHEHASDRVVVRTTADLLVVYDGSGRMLGGSTVTAWDGGVRF